MNFKHILYVVNALNIDFKGFEDALKWAQRANGSCSVYVVYPLIPESRDAFSNKYRSSVEKALEEQVFEQLKSYSQYSDVKASIIVEGTNKPAYAALEFAFTHSVDLIIKAAEGEESGFRAFDNTLLRLFDQSVYIVKSTSLVENSRLAVAIDAEAISKEEELLSKKLLKTAADIAEENKESLHAIACWEFVLEEFYASNLWSPSDDAERITLVRDYERSNRQNLDKLTSDLFLDSSAELTIHHKRGKPSKWIPHICASESVDLLIMGTLSRTGARGVVIGNTAENILQKIDCSILALKPDEFVSPLRLS